MSDSPITKNEFKPIILRVVNSYHGKSVNKFNLIGRRADEGDLLRQLGRPPSEVEKSNATKAFDELIKSDHLQLDTNQLVSSDHWATITQKGKDSIVSGIIDSRDELLGKDGETNITFEFPKSPSEQLLFTTARIEAINASDRKSSLGTGTSFFFQFKYNEDYNIPVLVTNRHVVEKFSLFRITLTQRKDDGSPSLRDKFEVIYEKGGGGPDWIFHPDPNIDLAVLPIEPLLKKIANDHNSPFFIAMDEKFIPNDSEWKELDAIEEITMIGYPNGLWDQVHNRPLVRRGITSSHPALAFNGKPEFLIDAACFTGSSGSPVFLYNQNAYREKNTGNIILGGRFYFLGILRAGPQHNVRGKLEIVDIPMADNPTMSLRIPNNLGFIIRSDQLLAFLPILKSKDTAL